MPPADKPFSPAFERNREPILKVLETVFRDPGEVLEIGSGSGQHAAYFAARLPQLRWQPSDVAGNLPGIRLWRDEAALENLAAPLALDVSEQPWRLPQNHYDGAFSANTAHIMAWPQVEQMFAGVALALASGGRFCLYGPFSYSGRHSSDGNVRFDATLRAQSSASGIRDLDELTALAARCGLALLQDQPMPANNRTLVWGKPQA